MEYQRIYQLGIIMLRVRTFGRMHRKYTHVIIKNKSSVYGIHQQTKRINVDIYA